MKQTLTDERLPIKLWLDDLESGALQQARNLANLPFAFHHIAIMPDAHLGYGMPIGGVLATEEVIIPNAVGVDIGCGMCAVKTSLKADQRLDLTQVMSAIRATIPRGFKHHKKPKPHKLMPEPDDSSGAMPVIEQEYNNARTQIGTLGGGNHFIEIQRDPAHNIWLMIHSGSRNLGFKVAQNYNKLAVTLNKRWETKIPSSWQLAYLPVDSPEGRHYLNEMDYCVAFAQANRLTMLQQVMAILQDQLSPDIDFSEPINIAHNYAAEEEHFGKRVFVHRKGATRAAAGEYGIIPGSQGSNSYIVRGKGNSDSFASCSHGAGRCMGRKQAQRELSLDEEKMKLKRRGVMHAVRGRRDLEEAPGAYKDIEKVMALQEDLVEIAETVSPVAVIKA